jgi:hypothetical protein
VSLDPAPGTVAAVFVALADPSRRQVIGVLAARGNATAGREVRYQLRPAPLRLAARWLDTAAGSWDDRLAAVKNAAERG